MIKINIEELVELKKKKMSYKSIAEYYEKQGKKISVSAIYNKLSKYYKERGEKLPRGNYGGKSKIEISDEELINLKEQGMSYKVIAKYYEGQGVKISVSAIYNKLSKYYEEKGEKPPRGNYVGKSKIEISDEELINLRKQGMSDKAIAKYYEGQGIKISFMTVNRRIRAHYELEGTEKIELGLDVKVSTNDLVKLKEQGMTDKAIAEYFIKQGKYISESMVRNRLKKYYLKLRKKKPIGKRISKTKIKISIKKMVELKEQGMSDKAIAEYFTAQGKNIAFGTVSKRLNEYYESIGEDKPKAKQKPKTKIDIPIENLVELKEQGMSDKAIAEYFTQQGRKISEATVSKKLKEYYESIGEDKPKAKPKAKPKEKKKEKEKAKTKKDIPIEKIVDLNNRGMSYKQIARCFTEDGMPISVATIGNKIRAYYKNVEKKERPKLKGGRPRAEIDEIEIFELKEQGMTDKQITEYLKRQGIEVDVVTVTRRLNEYYESIGKDKPKAKRKAKKMINISIEEIVELKEKGMNNKIIAEYYGQQGEKISEATVNRRLREYDLQRKAQNDTKLDDLLKKVLMKGTTTKEYFLENNEEILETDIEERARRLKIIVEHAKRQGDELVADEDFLEVMKLITNEISMHPQSKYVPYIKPYISKGKCENGNIELIRNNVFHGNKDLMTFVLLRLDLRYGQEYDVHIWNKQKNEYEQKIDKYFDRLHAVEENARKQAKEKKKSNKTETKKESNLSNSGEER